MYQKLLLWFLSATWLSVPFIFPLLFLFVLSSSTAKLFEWFFCKRCMESTCIHTSSFLKFCPVFLINASDLDSLMKSMVRHVLNFILFLPFTHGEEVLCAYSVFKNVILYVCNVLCCIFFFFDNQSAFHHRFLIKTEYFLAVNVFLNKQTKKP